MDESADQTGPSFELGADAGCDLTLSNSALACPLHVDHILDTMREILPGIFTWGSTYADRPVGLERLRDQARWMHGARGSTGTRRRRLAEFRPDKADREN